MALENVIVRGFAQGFGKQGVVAVKEGDAAFGLNDAENENGGHGRAEREAERGDAYFGIEDGTGEGGHDSKADGGNVQVAFGEEIGSNGIEAEGGSEGEGKPGESKGNHRETVAEEKEEEEKQRAQEEADDAPKRKGGWHGKRIEIIHVHRQ